MQNAGTKSSGLVGNRRRWCGEVGGARSESALVAATIAAEAVHETDLRGQSFGVVDVAGVGFVHEDTPEIVIDGL